MKHPVAILAFLGLNIVDAATTVHLVGQQNYKEYNPVMNWLLTLGPGAFVIGKMLLAAIGAALLVWKWPKLLGFATGFLAAVVIWQVFRCVG